MNGRRVLITGAGGFVGRGLATAFADRGWSVVGVDRTFDDGPIGPHMDRRIERVVADVQNGLPGEVEKADVVVHAAWITASPEALGVTSEEYERRNLLPLTAVLRDCSVLAPTAFVFLSSSGVFGPDDGSPDARGLSDTDEPTGDSPYARAKLRAERLVLERGNAVRDAVDGAAVGALAVHVVRLGYLFGPDEVARRTRPGVSHVARWFDAAQAGRPLEVRADDPAREWTFVPDLAEALERVVEAGAAGRPIHLGSPRVMRDSEVAALITAAIPGAQTVTVPAEGPVKPPMIPSVIPSLRDFVWTDVPTGLRTLSRISA